MSRLKNRTRRTPKKQFLVDHVASEAFAFASVGAALYLLAYKTYSVYLYHLGLGEMIGSFGLSQALRVTVLVASQSLGLLYLTMMISYLIYRPKLFSIIFSNPISMVLAFAFSILFYLEGFSTKVVINFVLLVLSIIVVLIIYRFNEGKRPDEKFELFLEQFSNKSFDSNPHPLSVMILRPIPSFFVDCFLFFLVFLPIVGTFLGTTIASGIHDGKVIQKNNKSFLYVMQEGDQYIFSEIDVTDYSRPKIPQWGGEVLILQGEIEGIKSLNFKNPIRIRYLNPNWQSFSQWWAKISERTEDPTRR